MSMYAGGSRGEFVRPRPIELHTDEQLHKIATTPGFDPALHYEARLEIERRAKRSQAPLAPFGERKS